MAKSKTNQVPAQVQTKPVQHLSPELIQQIIENQSKELEISRAIREHLLKKNF